MNNVKAGKYKICVITGSRAEYGLLKELLFKLKNSNILELQLVVTGSHLCDQFGNTKQEIIEDGFEFDAVSIPMEEDSKSGMAKSAGAALSSFAAYFENKRPELLVVLGDRYEILSAAYAAHLMGIPIAHISGGDVTEGAVDDGIRHCITKLSVLHFPGCEQSAGRIIQMGENPERVFNVGEPGVENCLKTNFLSREALAKNIAFDDILSDYGVVTYHPVTMEDNTAENQLYELIHAMDLVEGMSYIITLANADAGGRQVNEIWEREAKKHSNWLVVSSLGVLRYLSAMKYARLVLGNSSSGIVEAPSMGIPTVNIGDRQKGRMMAKSVICCEPEQLQIEKAIKKACSEAFCEELKGMESPFGDGRTSELICQRIQEFLENNKSGNIKTFYDIG